MINKKLTSPTWGKRGENLKDADSPETTSLFPERYNQKSTNYMGENPTFKLMRTIHHTEVVKLIASPEAKDYLIGRKEVRKGVYQEFLIKKDSAQ